MEDAVLRIIDMARGRSCECEVYGESMREFTIEMHRGEVESIERSDDAGIGVRLVRDGRIGFAYSNDLTPTGVERAFEEAHRNAACSSPMDFDCLADDRTPERTDDLYPVYPPEGNEHDKVELVRSMEDACLSHDPAVFNTEGAGYEEVVGDVFVASTRGFARRERRGFCMCRIAAVARRGDDVRSGDNVAQGLHPDRIDFAAVGRTAAERAVGLLGSKRIATKRYPVLIDGAASVEIVDMLAETLSAEMAVKGMSILAGRLGRRVARDTVSIVDDPFLDAGCFNAAFDAEGTPTERSVLIESGGLKAYLLNAYSSRKMGVRPVGNAVRHSFKDRPVPGPSNLYVAPGTRTRGEMIADLADGVYVQNIMGMHTADTISGDFSVGINGRHVCGGEVAEPVCEMTMSGNILELLGRVEEVGRDLVFRRSYGSPSILVESMSVSGT